MTIVPEEKRVPGKPGKPFGGKGTGSRTYRVATPEGAEKYGQPIGTIITLDGTGKVVGTAKGPKPATTSGTNRPAADDDAAKRPAAKPDAPAADAPADAPVGDDQAPAAPKKTDPKTARMEEVRATLRTNADLLEAGPDRRRKDDMVAFLRALAEDENLIVGPPGTTLVGKKEPEGSKYTLADMGTGMSLGPASYGVRKADVVPLINRLSAAFANGDDDKGPLLGSPETPDRLKTWKREGKNPGRVAVEERAAFDTEKGQTGTLAQDQAEQFRLGDEEQKRREAMAARLDAEGYTGRAGRSEDGPSVADIMPGTEVAFTYNVIDKRRYAFVGLSKDYQGRVLIRAKVKGPGVGQDRHRNNFDEFMDGVRYPFEEGATWETMDGTQSGSLSGVPPTIEWGNTVYMRVPGAAPAADAPNTEAPAVGAPSPDAPAAQAPDVPPAKRLKTPESYATSRLVVGDIIEVDGQDVTITGIAVGGGSSGTRAGGRQDTVTATGIRADGSLWWDSSYGGARVTRVAKAGKAPDPAERPSTYEPATREPAIDTTSPSYDPTWSESSQNAALRASDKAESEGTGPAHREAMVAHRQANNYPGTDRNYHSERMTAHDREWRRLTATPAKIRKYEAAAAAADALTEGATTKEQATAALEARRLASAAADEIGDGEAFERYRTGNIDLSRIARGAEPRTAPAAETPPAAVPDSPEPTPAAPAEGMTGEDLAGLARTSPQDLTELVGTRVRLFGAETGEPYEVTVRSVRPVTPGTPEAYAESRDGVDPVLLVTFDRGPDEFGDPRLGERWLLPTDRLVPLDDEPDAEPDAPAEPEAPAAPTYEPSGDAALDRAVQVALTNLEAESNVRAEPVGFIVARTRNGFYRVFSADAWTRPSETPALPWSPPEETPLMRVTPDGAVSRLSDEEVASITALDAAAQVDADQNASEAATRQATLDAVQAQSLPSRRGNGERVVVVLPNGREVTGDLRKPWIVLSAQPGRNGAEPYYSVSFHGSERSANSEAESRKSGWRDGAVQTRVVEVPMSSDAPVPARTPEVPDNAPAIEAPDTSGVVGSATTTPRGPWRYSITAPDGSLITFASERNLYSHAIIVKDSSGKWGLLSRHRTESTAQDVFGRAQVRRRAQTPILVPIAPPEPDAPTAPTGRDLPGFGMGAIVRLDDGREGEISREYANGDVRFSWVADGRLQRERINPVRVIEVTMPAADPDAPEWNGSPDLSGLDALSETDRAEVMVAITTLREVFNVPLLAITARQEDWDQMGGGNSLALGGRRIYLNPAILNDPAARERHLNGGYTTATSLTDIITHEFGHTIDKRLQRDDPAAWTALNEAYQAVIDRASRPEVVEQNGVWDEARNNWRFHPDSSAESGISQYAFSSTGEFVPEAFTRLMQGTSNDLTDIVRNAFARYVRQDDEPNRTTPETATDAEPETRVSPRPVPGPPVGLMGVAAMQREDRSLGNAMNREEHGSPAWIALAARRDLITEEILRRFDASQKTPPTRETLAPTLPPEADTPAPENPVTAEYVLEDATYADLEPGDRILDDDREAVVLENAFADDGGAEVDVRYLDNTRNTIFAPRSMYVQRIRAEEAVTLPEQVYVPPPIPRGVPKGRVALTTTQRRVINEMALDSDMAQPEIVRLAAARLRAKQPLTPDEHRAMQAAMRTRSQDESLDARRRALLQRVTQRFGYAADSAEVSTAVRGTGRRRPPQAAVARKVAVGDGVRIPATQGYEEIQGKVTAVRKDGTMRVLTIRDENGREVERTLLGGTYLEVHPGFGAEEINDRPLVGDLRPGDRVDLGDGVPRTVVSVAPLSDDGDVVNLRVNGPDGEEDIPFGRAVAVSRLYGPDSAPEPEPEVGPRQTTPAGVVVGEVIVERYSDTGKPFTYRVATVEPLMGGTKYRITGYIPDPEGMRQFDKQFDSTLDAADVVTVLPDPGDDKPLPDPALPTPEPDVDVADLEVGDRITVRNPATGHTAVKMISSITRTDESTDVKFAGDFGRGHSFETGEKVERIERLGPDWVREQERQAAMTKMTYEVAESLRETQREAVSAVDRIIGRARLAGIVSNANAGGRSGEESVQDMLRRASGTVETEIRQMISTNASIIRSRQDSAKALLGSEFGIEPLAEQIREVQVAAALRTVQRMFEGFEKAGALNNDRINRMLEAMRNDNEGGVVRDYDAEVGILVRNAPRFADAPTPVTAESTAIPTAADLKARIEAMRQTMPSEFGSAYVQRMTYGNFTLASLEAGETPPLVATAAGKRDTAADGGPGETTMGHLETVRRAGTLLQEQIEARVDRILYGSNAAEARRLTAERDAIAKEINDERNKIRDLIVREENIGLDSVDALRAELRSLRDIGRTGRTPQQTARYDLLSDLDHRAAFGTSKHPESRFAEMMPRLEAANAALEAATVGKSDGIALSEAEINALVRDDLDAGQAVTQAEWDFEKRWFEDHPFEDFTSLVAIENRALDARAAGDRMRQATLQGVVVAARMAQDKDKAVLKARRAREKTKEAREAASKRKADTGIAQRTARARAAREVLAEVRELGSKGDARFTIDTSERSELSKGVRWAEQFYPTDWLEKQKGNRMEVIADPIRKTRKGWSGGRGRYEQYVNSLTGRTQRRVLRLGKKGETVLGSGEYGQNALHELGHHMESLIPGLARAEDAFLWSRTTDPGTEVGSRTRVGPKNKKTSLGYSDKSEVAREDEFLQQYAGKEYAGNSFEIFTMGMESLFGGSNAITHLEGESVTPRHDADYEAFMLGVLALL